jgi:hypothetical protein
VKQSCVLKRANVLNFQLKQQLGTQTIIKSLATKAQAFVLLSKAKQPCVLKGTNVLNLQLKQQLRIQTIALTQSA